MKIGLEIQYGYDVIEHYTDEPPEDFGSYTHPEGEPKIGEVILLRWLDGRPAHEATIIAIAGSTLHVRKVAT
jgi:hypothetical protein